MMTQLRPLINLGYLHSSSPACAVQRTQTSQYALKEHEGRGEVCGYGEETTIYGNIKNRDIYLSLIF